MTDSARSTWWSKIKHFLPLSIELIVHFVVALNALELNVRPVSTTLFSQLMPIIQLFAIISIVSYCLAALSKIRKYHLWLQDNYSNDEAYHLRWLYRLIIIFGIFWLMLVPYTLIDYLFFDFQLSIADYYPIYLLMSIITIWISAEAFLKPEIVFVEAKEKVAKNLVQIDEDLSKEAEWLKLEMQTNQYFLDPEITIRKLAESLEIHPNKLSKLINSGLGKNFADFINQYRVDAVIKRINDPKYSHITLLGISFECGFNSKTTFNRVFKNMTGQTPFQFKKSGTKV